MTTKNLTDLYVHELQDLYSADKQAATVTKKLIDTASDAKLVEALEDSLKGIEEGMEIITDICSKHGEKPSGTMCKGMKGLVEEVEAHVFDEEFAGEEVQDASIVAQNQRMTHYAIAGYGTAAAFAKALGQDKDASDLKKCLDGCYDGDRRLTEIAENTVNSDAMAD